MRLYVRVLILLALCVLVPCVVVFSVINYHTFSQYQESVSNSQIERLQTVASVNALIIKNIEQGALRFSLEPAIKALGSLTELDFGPGNNEHLSDLLRTQRMLVEFVGTNNLLDSVYLYINGSDYIISSRDSYLSMDRFEDHGWLQKYEALRLDARVQRMMPAHIVSSRYGAAVNPGDYYHRCLTYVYPITPITSTFHGALVFNILEDKLMELYMGSSGNENFAVFSNEGELLTGNSDLNYALVPQEETWLGVFTSETPDSGYFFSDADGKMSQCSYFRSQDGGYVFVAVQNMSILMGKTISVQIVAVIFLIVFIPVIALLVIVISRRLYSPIGLLVKEIESNSRINIKGEKDTLSALSTAMKELLLEDQRLFSDRGREKLRDAAVLRILSGDDNGGDDEDIRAIMPHSMNICAICMPDTSIAQRGQFDNYDSRIRLLIRFIEKEFADDAICPTVTRYDENLIIIILSIDESVSDPEEALHTRLINMQPGAAAILGDTVTFAAGSFNGRLLGIRQCFDQAKNAMSYRFIYGLGSILLYDRVCENASYYNADERIHYIQHCLTRYEKDDAIESITGLFNNIQNFPNVSIICVSQILNQLATILIQYSIMHEIQLDELTGDSMSIYHGLWQQNRTLNEACTYFCKIFEAVIDYQNASNSSMRDYMNKILEYVRENYYKDITIDNIASHIGISYSYLRKLFKEATDRNLVDYINDLRINKAKQLLSDTNYTIKIIAEMCGFNHERSFSRIFAQYEGVTPGKYKTMHKNNVLT